jgi:ABC-type sugar transport system ATPase subunit
MSEVRVEGLTKRFGRVTAVDDLAFTFSEGRVTCLLGPSGCGKTTLLRIIAGLQTPDEGRVFFGDVDVTDLPPRKRNIGMVFQSSVVYRGISVYRNIELPLLMRKLPEAERRERIREVLDLLNLHEVAARDISQLDNVSRQKVSVARAVAYRPDIILFDEPMTSIDSNSKIQFRHFFKELSKKLRQVIVYVTHDQTEAMTLADEIALMEGGRIVQHNDARTLYGEPESVFGGWFLGNPGMNFMKGTCESRDERDTVVSTFFAAPQAVRAEQAEGIPRELTIGIRPEHVRLSASPRQECVEATVRRKSITVGGQYLFDVERDGVRVKVKASNPPAELKDARTVWIELPVEHLVLFDGNQRRVRAHLG